MTELVKAYVSLREDWPLIDIDTRDTTGANAEIPRKLIDALEKARNDARSAQDAVWKYLGLHEAEDVFRLEPLDG